MELLFYLREWKKPKYLLTHLRPRHQADKFFNVPFLATISLLRYHGEKIMGNQVFISFKLCQLFYL